MRKLLRVASLFLILSISLQVEAQLVLTPIGFVSKEDSTKNYIVIKMDSLSQGEIFKKTLI